MTLKCPVGPELNIFNNSSEENCRRLNINTPILTQYEIYKLKNICKQTNNSYWKSITLDCTFKAYSGKESMLNRINELCIAAENAIIKNNVPIIILSDRKSSEFKCPIPSLMIIGAIHH